MRKPAPIVQRTCEEFGVPYTTYPHIQDAWWSFLLVFRAVMTGEDIDADFQRRRCEPRAERTNSARTHARTPRGKVAVLNRTSLSCLSAANSDPCRSCRALGSERAERAWPTSCATWRRRAGATTRPPTERYLLAF
jgi:hypothetical protein